MGINCASDLTPRPKWAALCTTSSSHPLDTFSTVWHWTQVYWNKQPTWKNFSFNFRMHCLLLGYKFICPLFLLHCFHGTSLSRMHILWERRKTHYFLIWEFPQSRALHLPARKHMQMDSQRNLFLWFEILNEILASAWFELPFNGHTEKEIISTMQANLPKMQSI